MTRARRHNLWCVDAALAATPTPDPEANRVADTPCAHERITTASADGLPSLWYCDDCRRRFYPACETCVDVGHRNGHPAERADGEVERLREALRHEIASAVWGAAHSGSEFTCSCGYDGTCWPHEEADAVLDVTLDVALRAALTPKEPDR